MHLPYKVKGHRTINPSFSAPLCKHGALKLAHGLAEWQKPEGSKIIDVKQCLI